MTFIDRRGLLASASALAFSAIANDAFGKSAAKKAASAPVTTEGLAPPVASVRPVTETIFGTTLTDNYRWMENSSDPEWMPYLMGQNAYARHVLGKIPGREELAQKIGGFTGDLAIVSAVQAAGPYIFTELRPAGANTFKLYVREGIKGKDRLLIDPDKYASAGTHYSLDYWQVSPDGSHVAYGISPAGSENSTLKFLETAGGSDLPDLLDRAQFGPPSWAPDGSGVFMNRLKEGTKHGDPDHYADSVSWFHRLGADPATDVKVMGKGLDPSVPMTDVSTPFVGAQAGTDFAFGSPVDGVQNEIGIYISPLAAAMSGKAVWKKACATEDDVTGYTVLGDSLYFQTHKNASRFRLVKTPLAAPSFSTAVEVVPESTAVIKTLTTARDGIYVQTLDAGVGKLFRLAADGSTKPLSLPFDGSIAALYTDPLKDGCWFVLQSWVKPPVLCYGGPDGIVTVTDIAPQPSFDVSAYASEEVMVTARDGAKVPLSIVYRKGMKRDGSAPLYLQAYGSYAIDIDPGFSPRYFPWLDLGCVFAVAHVRGGGELGEDWHKAGQKLTKPNTWHDCIDCAEYLIAQKWTGKSKLAVEGTSAGGIMIGRFLTERPDLLAVAIVRVGDSNATRMETMEAGPANIPEFGTIKDPDGFKGLLEMDAYQHVKAGTHYPAILLTTGVHDPRVAPWEPGKFTAKLQTATASKKPVILRVETDAGHGLGSTRTQRDVETADTFAFILWQTGDKRFQPKKA